MKRKTLTELVTLGISVPLCVLVAVGTVSNQGSTNVVPEKIARETEAEKDLIPLCTRADVEEVTACKVKATEEAEEETTTEAETTQEETETETETVAEWMPYEFVSLDSSVQYGIKAVCDEYEVAYDLIIAICMQESSLNPNCIGDNGKAFGLGQIREEYWSGTAAELGLSEWKTDPVQNSEMVCYIIGRQLNGFGQTLEATLNIYRHGKTTDMVEPDGMTYVEHIKANMSWLEENKEE